MHKKTKSNPLTNFLPAKERQYKCVSTIVVNTIYAYLLRITSITITIITHTRAPTPIPTYTPVLFPLSLFIASEILVINDDSE